MANKEYRQNKISKLNIEQKEYFIYGYCYRLVQELIENEDEYTTLRIVFNKGFHMKPGQTVEISFDTSLNLSLPVDLTISNKDNKYISNIMPNTSPSYISYKWLGNERIYKVYLPECGLFTDRMWI